MKKETIDKAATDSCVIDNGIINPQIVPFYEQGFRDGARWRINSVWHGTEKLPDVGKLIIVDVASDYDLCYYEDCQVWKSARKWAYIEDLIHNKED